MLSCLNPEDVLLFLQPRKYFLDTSLLLDARGNLHLEVLDGGGLASFFQGLVYPADYNVIISFLTVTQVLEDIQRVPENQQRE